MVEYKQDMPPLGGYAPVVYKRIPLKRGWSNFVKLGVFVGVSTLGWIHLLNGREKIVNERIEMRCGRIALEPLLMAESDRLFLKQLKRNYEAEEKIMKDVEGWETGKWKGKPVLTTLPPDTYFKVNKSEYYAHCDEKYYKETVQFYLSH